MADVRAQEGASLLPSSSQAPSPPRRGWTMRRAAFAAVACLAVIAVVVPVLAPSDDVHPVLLARMPSDGRATQLSDGFDFPSALSKFAPWLGQTGVPSPRAHTDSDTSYDPAHPDDYANEYKTGDGDGGYTRDPAYETGADDTNAPADPSVSPAVAGVTTAHHWAHHIVNSIVHPVAAVHHVTHTVRCYVHHWWPTHMHWWTYDVRDREDEAATRLGYHVMHMWDTGLLPPKADGPLFTPNGGKFVGKVKVAIHDGARGDGRIFYTTDGSAPTSESTEFTVPFTLPVGTYHVKAIALPVSGYLDSKVSEQTFVVMPQADRPQILPRASGPYTETVTVDLSTDTDGGEIRYTTDGKHPTFAYSELYTKPFILRGKGLHTVKAYTMKNDMGDSRVKTRRYYIQSRVATPTFTPLEKQGPFIDQVTVSIACKTHGATIRYTLDGTEPTIHSEVYQGPFVVTEDGDVTVTATATANGMGKSYAGKTTLSVLPRVQRPVFSPDTDGPFVTSVMVTITSGTPDAFIHYTTDGSDPTEASNRYSAPFPLLNVGDYTLKARGFHDDMGTSHLGTQDFVIIPKAAAPTFTPSDKGPFVTSVRVTLDSLTPGALIRYTTDGTAPTRASSVTYTGPFSVSTVGAAKIRAFASHLKYGDSDVVEHEYEILARVPPVTFSPTVGKATAPFVEEVTVSLSSIAGASIYYTTDGSTPTEDSTWFVYPFKIDKVGQTVVKAFAVHPHPEMGDSFVEAVTYTVIPRVSAPSFTPGTEGPYVSRVTITLATTTPLATIRYTTDGSEPSRISSTLYSKPFHVVTTGETTVKAFASHLNMGDSEVSSQVFNVLERVPPVKITPDGGDKLVGTVTITLASIAGSSIFYTTDGSLPNTAATKYTAPFELSTIGTTTVAAMATHPHPEMGDSHPASASFTILQAAAAVVFEPASGGPYTTTVTVTLSSTSKGAAIFYTSDGTKPSASSTPYSAPFTITNVGDNLVQAVAVKAGMADSPLASQTYTVQQKAPVPSITPTSGPFVETATVTLSSSAPDARLYYTLDGSTPTTSSTHYADPFTISTVGTTTVKAITVANGMGESSVASQDFKVLQRAAAVAFSPEGGKFRRDADHHGATVALSSSTAGAAIYFTTDGSDPTGSSAHQYSAPFTICKLGQTTVKAVAKEKSMADSVVAEEEFGVQARICVETVFSACPPEQKAEDAKMLADHTGCTYWK